MIPIFKYQIPERTYKKVKICLLFPIIQNHGFKLQEATFQWNVRQKLSKRERWWALIHWISCGDQGLVYDTLIWIHKLSKSLNTKG